MRVQIGLVCVLALCIVAPNVQAASAQSGKGVEAVTSDGTVVPSTAFLEAEWARNVRVEGSGRLSTITVSPNPSADVPVTAAPSHFRVNYDNDEDLTVAPTVMLLLETEKRIIAYHCETTLLKRDARGRHTELAIQSGVNAALSEAMALAKPQEPVRRVLVGLMKFKERQRVVYVFEVKQH